MPFGRIKKSGVNHGIAHSLHSYLGSRIYTYDIWIKLTPTRGI